MYSTKFILDDDIFANLFSDTLRKNLLKRFFKDSIENYKYIIAINVFSLNWMYFRNVSLSSTVSLAECTHKILAVLNFELNECCVVQIDCSIIIYDDI